MESVSIPTTKLPLNALTPHPENYNSHSGDQIKELAESLTTFGQFKNIVVWTCSENITLENGLQLHEGLTYILAGHGLWQAAMEAGLDELEVKDYSGLSYEMALTLLMTDNAAPLGSEPIPEKLAALMEKTRAMVADKPGLSAMLARLKEKADQLRPFNPDSIEFKEYDESVADEVEYIECPECGHKFPK